MLRAGSGEVVKPAIHNAEPFQNSLRRGVAGMRFRLARASNAGKFRTNLLPGAAMPTAKSIADAILKQLCAVGIPKRAELMAAEYILPRPLPVFARCAVERHSEERKKVIPRGVGAARGARTPQSTG